MSQHHFEIPHASARALARILLIDNDDTSRMTLAAVLEAGGYQVTHSTTTVDAVDRLNENSFELVLCHADGASSEIDPAILSYARFREYQPATALLHTMHSPFDGEEDGVVRQQILVEPENIPDLLDDIAGLIGARASSMIEQELQYVPSLN
ncbi:MAG: response regulator [Bryobacterales bacterium]|nr:response regulator [Bryobacterales bacterium]